MVETLRKLWNLYVKMRLRPVPVFLSRRGGNEVISDHQGPLTRLKKPYLFSRGTPYTTDQLAPMLRPVASNCFKQPITYDPLIETNPDDADEAGSFPVPTAYLMTMDDDSIDTGTQKRVVEKYKGKFKAVWEVE